MGNLPNRITIFPTAFMFIMGVPHATASPVDNINRLPGATAFNTSSTYHSVSFADIL